MAGCLAGLLFLVRGNGLSKVPNLLLYSASWRFKESTPPSRFKTTSSTASLAVLNPARTCSSKVEQISSRPERVFVALAEGGSADGERANRGGGLRREVLGSVRVELASFTSRIRQLGTHLPSSQSRYPESYPDLQLALHQPHQQANQA